MNKRVDAIPVLTDSLVSDLIAQGWPLESLHVWHRHFLKQRSYSVQENLDFMLKQFRRPTQEFAVTLRINGATRLQAVDDFGGFDCSPASGITSKTDAERKFAESGHYVVFARGTFSGVDFTSAAIAARSQFESLLDLLRFEYERTSLKIDSRSFVTRLGDNQTDLVAINNPVPNPVESLNDDDFKAFSKKLDGAMASPKLDSETKSRVRTAFRQNRFGSDSESYSDKFLNWWMGLEALANVDGEYIGRTVTRNVSHAMLTGYLFRLLRDLLTTLKYIDIKWESDWKAVSGADSVRGLNVPGLVKLIQDQKDHDIFSNQLQDHPVVAYETKRIAVWLCEPKKAAEQLESHRQRLEWHLNRLYRIRCCIVHGAPVRFRLALFAANLEYYLKQTLIFVLDAFHDHPHIKDLPSLFHRSTTNWDRTIRSLKDNSATIDTINDAVFADVVIQK
ncbi:MAG: hypothetical protein WCH39_22390 [Schlesneria sp.]